VKGKNRSVLRETNAGKVSGACRLCVCAELLKQGRAPDLGWHSVPSCKRCPVIARHALAAGRQLRCGARFRARAGAGHAVSRAPDGPSCTKPARQPLRHAGSGGNAAGAGAGWLQTRCVRAAGRTAACLAPGASADATGLRAGAPALVVPALTGKAGRNSR
jgi:hypothetical protein